MKSSNIKSALFVSVLTLFIIAGCLKDKNLGTGIIQPTYGNETKIVEIKLTAANASNFFVLAVDANNIDTTVDLVPVNLATKDPAPEDLHVTVDLDPALLTAYNDANGTDYEEPSPDVYTILNPVVTIPKGSHTGYIQIKFNPTNFTDGRSALGFKITAIKETGYLISGNLNTGITVIVAKNQYDGLYYAHGVFNHPTPGVGGPFVFDGLPLSTSGANSVDMYAQPYGDNGLVGAFPRLTVNPDNSVTVTSADPTSPFNGPFDPDYKSYYDPATRTFYINYGYTTSAPRTAYDTLEYIGPR